MSSLGTPLLTADTHVDGVPVSVSAREWHRCEHLGTIYHFEFRSKHEPPRPIPVSPTGYRSHFAYAADIEEFPTLLEAAKAIAAGILRGRRRESDDSAQPGFFD